MRDGAKFFRQHVGLFNAGVRSGDFGPMLERFAEDAELVFEGVPAGPYRGKDAIAAAYRDRPPDDEIEILDVREEEEGLVVARYRWRDPTAAAGRMLLTRDGDLITRLVVTFDQASGGG